MSNLVQTYIIHDSNPSLYRGARRVSYKNAKEWNEKGFGIFHTVQHFHKNRKIDNLVSINAWAIDMDDGSKEWMMSKIKSGLLPTMVVETKRGYHVYWKAKNGTKENWKNILTHRLVPFYGADKRAKDLARLLRTPGFYHMKDPGNPFLIKKIWEHPVEYSEQEIIHFYPDLMTKKLQEQNHRRAKRLNPIPGSFWDQVWNLDCEEALRQLSGTSHVGFETYHFTENASGTKNILVNGKSSSCWIDQDGRIGSCDDGGPTIYQWLNWFHKNPSYVIDIIKKEFLINQEKHIEDKNKESGGREGGDQLALNL